MGLYQMYAAGDYTLGAMMKRPDAMPVSLWCYYFRVPDIDAALKRRSNATADRWSTARWKSPAANSSCRASIRKARCSRLSANAESETMADYTFYTNPMSVWADRPLLYEAQADYEQVLLTYGGTIAEPAYLAINPMGKVSVHHHEGGDRIITECAAICHYLAETAAPGLLADDAEKSVHFRLFFAAGPLKQAITARNTDGSAEPEKQATTGFGSYERTVDAFETLLQGRDFVCGERFTMADVTSAAK